jgi:hypothetical protein
MDDLGLMLHVMQDVLTRIKVGSSEEKPICMISKGMVLSIWWELDFGYAMNLMKVCAVGPNPIFHSIIHNIAMHVEKNIFRRLGFLIDLRIINLQTSNNLF